MSNQVSHALKISFFSIFILCFSLLINAPAQESLDTHGYKIVSLKKGDRCIVCDMLLKGTSGVALLIKGRRVAIGKQHIDEFFGNMDYYFSRLQPQGALFQESAVVLKTLKSGWFIFGTVIVISLIMGALSCHKAIKKGYSAIAWFFIGFFLNVIGFLWITLKKKQTDLPMPRGWLKIPTTRSPVYCPNCGAENHPSAIRCMECQNELSPKIESEVLRT